MDACRAIGVFSFLLCCSAAFGQGEPGKLPDKKVTLSSRGVRLDSLFKEVSRRTGFIFSYSTRNVNTALMMDVPPGTYSLAELLLKIKAKTGLDYLIAENHIILKTAKRTASLPDRRKDEGNRHPDHVGVAMTSEPMPGTAAREHTVNAQNVRVELLREVFSIPRPGLSAIAAKRPEKIEIASAGPVAVPRSTTPTKRVSATKKSSVPTAVPQRFQLKAGLSGDETLYAGPALQIGIPALYATVSYKTNFSAGMLSYGLGTSFRFSNTVRASLFITTGAVSSTFRFHAKSPTETSTIIFDPTHINSIIVVKSRLTRIGFVLEKSLTTKLCVQAGVQFNSLSTHYIDYGAPSAIGYLGSDADKNVYALRPPYVFKNTYSPTSDSNLKYWAGAQVSLLYVIDFSAKR